MVPGYLEVARIEKVELGQWRTVRVNDGVWCNRNWASCYDVLDSLGKEEEVAASSTAQNPADQNDIP